MPEVLVYLKQGLMQGQYTSLVQVILDMQTSLPPQKKKSEISQSYLKGILPVNQHTYMRLTDNSRPLVRFFIF